MSALSPYRTEYATEVSYLTEAEFLATPTALSIQDLIPDGSQAEQDGALSTAIARASSWVDNILNQPLAVNSAMEQGWYRVDRYGRLNVPLENKPLLEVTSVSLGTKPSNLTPLASLADVCVNRSTIEIPAANQVVASKVLVQVGYLAGYAVTTVADPVTATSTSLPLISVAGVYPGTSLTIADGARTEHVVVDSVTGSTATLTSGLAYAHATGVAVGNLPNRAKEACALLTVVVIQTRGNDAIILDALEQPMRLSSEYGASGVNMNLAMTLLKKMDRVR